MPSAVIPLANAIRAGYWFTASSTSALVPILHREKRQTRLLAAGNLSSLRPVCADLPAAELNCCSHPAIKLHLDVFGIDINQNIIRHAFW
jgi:hypothetical protein